MPRVTLTAAELAGLGKSAQTPMLESTPRILGPNGLWRTPDQVTSPISQKLPDYIEQVAGALMDQQGMHEQQAIATAINAIKRWAKGKLGWGRTRSPGSDRGVSAWRSRSGTNSSAPTTEPVT